MGKHLPKLFVGGIFVYSLEHNNGMGKTAYFEGYPYANYGRHGTRYRLMAEHRLLNHDMAAIER